MKWLRRQRWFAGIRQVSQKTSSLQHSSSLHTQQAISQRQDLCTVRISLHGGAVGERLKQQMIAELAAGAKHTLLAKGFISVEQGIDVKDTQLTFPCAVSARAFYLLFDNYECESSNGCASMTITVHSDHFRKDMENPTLKRLFVSSSAVTPSNIFEHFAMGH